MKITYERTGGVAGIRKRAVLETHSLGADERAEWEGLVETAAFFSMPVAIGPANPQLRDAFSHTIRVEDGGREHTIEVQGTPDEGPVRRLLDRLQARATRG